jgi:hypothetical protein
MRSETENNMRQFFNKSLIFNNTVLNQRKKVITENQLSSAQGNGERLKI